MPAFDERSFTTASSWSLRIAQDAPNVPKRAERSSKWVIPHDSPYAYAWSIFLVIMLTYLATIVPYAIAFLEDTPETIQVFDWIMDIAFIVDVAVNFFLTYEDDDGR